MDTATYSSGKAEQAGGEEARSNSSGVNIEYLKKKCRVELL
jgi:hypothetical protein